MGGKWTNEACCCAAPGEREYKLVVAQVDWFGRYGFMECSDQNRNAWDLDPCPGSVCTSYIPYSPTPPDHKYLERTFRMEWSSHHERQRYFSQCVPDPPCHSPYPMADELAEVYDFEFRWNFHERIDKYSGVRTIEETITWDDSSTSGAGVVTESHLTGTDATDKFLTMFPPRIGIDAVCGNIIVVNDGWGGLVFLDSGHEVTSSHVDDTSVGLSSERVYHSDLTQPCGCLPPIGDDPDPADPTYRDVINEFSSFRVEEVLGGIFTSAELYSMAVSLLALWDLNDDTRYPWRSSCNGSSYNLGALVTYNYGGGTEYPVGTPGVPGAVIGGPVTGETWASGPHALFGYAALGFGGGSALFTVIPDATYFWDGQMLILGKWAEKKVSVPSHNWARPCGEDYWATVSQYEPTYWIAAGVSADTALCWTGAGTPFNTLNTNGSNVTEFSLFYIYWLDSDVPTAKVYQFVSALTPVEGEVLMGATADDSMTNLKNAINHTGTPGTDYECAAAHPGVSAAYSSPVLTLTSLHGTATYFRHFLETNTNDPVWTFAHIRLIGTECTSPCNSDSPTGTYSTQEYTWIYRTRLEAQRMNKMIEIDCPLVDPPDGDGGPCQVDASYPYTVPPLWTVECTEANASVGDVIYCSPNAEGFTGSPDAYGFPATIASDDKYGFQWNFHIRQEMPDPLITCLGLYPTAYPDTGYLTPVLMEEARCCRPLQTRAAAGCADAGARCTALPSVPATPIYYCPDSDDTGCGNQDGFGNQCPAPTQL